MGDNKVQLVHESTTRSIIGAFYHVFSYLGLGFLESVYAAALTKVLRDCGHVVEREVPVSVWFEDEVIARHRLDMLVDKKVVVELKAGDRLTDGAFAVIRLTQRFRTEPNADPFPPHAMNRPP